MLPVSDMSSILYPMTADLYYSTQTQNDFGEIERSWDFDRTINCSAIKERPASRMSESLDTYKFIEYDFRIDFRTEENVTISSMNEDHRITEVIITNIKDPAGTVVWFETSTQPTNFEIQNLEPMFDMDHILFGYRVLIQRSDKQEDLT